MNAYPQPTYPFRLMALLLLPILLMPAGWNGVHAQEVADGTYTSYVLDDASEVEVMTGGSAKKEKTYKLNGPGSILSFEYYTNSGLTTGSFYIKGTDTNGNTLLNESFSDYKKNTWKARSYNLNQDIRSLTFSSGGILTKKIRNVKVTRATTLTGIHDLDLGEIRVGTSRQATFSVEYNNTFYPQTIKASGYDANILSISNIRVGETGQAEISLTFTPKEAKEYNETVTLTMGSLITTFTLRANAVTGKATPTFGCHLTQAYTNQTLHVADCFYTDNNEAPFTVICDDPTLAVMQDDNTIMMTGKEGTATFTMHQEETENFIAQTRQFTIAIVKPQTHLPQTITGENYGALVSRENGDFNWDNGICLGNKIGGGLNWDDKTAVIHFEGIPEQISFNYNVTAAGPTGMEWYMEESPDGSNYSRIWNTSDETGTVSSTLNPATRYVRLCYSGNFAGIFSDIHITELRYLTVEPQEIDFGRWMESEDVPARVLTLQHCNAGPGVTVTSSNPTLFAVTPATIEGTGADRMGEVALSVKYMPEVPGEHTATITIADPHGQNAPVQVTVSGQARSGTLILVPDQEPAYEALVYRHIILQRTLPAGWSTLSLPCSATIDEIAPGQTGAYTARLALVTYNENDGYSLYFRRVEDGTLQPNQPYLIYLTAAVAHPQLGMRQVETPAEGTLSSGGWSMQSNYTPALPMEGKYGMAGGQLRRGLAGSTLNGYAAYFTPPTETRGICVRLAVEDGAGGTTWIGNLTDNAHILPRTIYGADGMQRSKLQQGVNIVRRADGTTQKVWKE